MAISIGISPSARHVGLAVIKDNQLLHWWTLNMAGQWSPKKFRKIMDALDLYLCENTPDAIGVKIPDDFTKKRKITMFMSGINIHAQGFNLRAQYFTLTQIKMAFNIHGNISVMDLYQKVAEIYPELKREYTKSKELNYNYHRKVLEAVLAAHLCRI